MISKVLFTNYITDNNGAVVETYTDKVCNFLLTPLDAAVGKKISVIQIETNESGQTQVNDKFTPFQNKRSLTMRITAGVIATLVIPFTLIGCLLRATSSSHQALIKKEDQYIQNQKKLYEQKVKILEEFRRNFDSINQLNTQDIDQNLQGLAKLAGFLDDFITRNKKILDKNDLVPFSRDFEKRLIGLVFKKEVQAEATERDLNEEFTSNVTYDQLLLLKRTLSLLEWHREHFFWREPTKIKSFHKVIRNLYYEKFSVDHMARKLNKKEDRIDSIRLSKSYFVEDGKEEIDQVAIEEARKAFHEKHKPTEVTWLHGTSSSTLVAVATTDRQIKPSGHLKTENKVSFFGEHAGYSISRECVSGAPLKGAGFAMNYARGKGVGVNDNIGIKCAKRPVEMIEYYRKEFNQILNQINSNNILMILDEYQGNNNVEKQKLINLHRHMKILLTLEPSAFKEKILPLIFDIAGKLKEFAHDSSKEETQHSELERAVQALLEKVFNPIATFESNLPQYQMEDQIMIREAYPVLFGSSSIELSNEKDKGQGSSTGKKVARLAGDASPNTYENEYAHKGCLTLEKDLQYVFVPHAKVQSTKDYLQRKKIHGIKVYNMETLKFATIYEVFRDKKMKENPFKRNPVLKLQTI